MRIRQIALLMAAAAGFSACTSDKGIQDRLSKRSTADHFIYFTDAHVDYRIDNSTASVLDSLLAVVPTRRVVFGGDATMTTMACRTKEDIDASWRIFQDCIDVAIGHGCDFLMIRGNHETTTGTIDPEVAGFTYSQGHTYEKVMKPAAGSDIVELGNGTCNYYFESPKSRIRYIVLDPYSSAEEDLEVRYGVAMEYAAASTAWLKECLEGMPEGWNAVVLIHQGMNRCTGIGDYGNCRGMLKLVNDNAGKVKMVLHGHVHKDVETFENGVLHVATTSSNSGQAKPDIFGIQERVRGTGTETAIDVVDIDIDGGRINIFRTGGGYSRLFHLNPETIPVGGKLTLKSSLQEVSSWTVYDADGIHAPRWTNWDTEAYIVCERASIEGSTIQGKAPGEIVAIATDENQMTREYFYLICK